jgi:hypothetical protein
VIKSAPSSHKYDVEEKLRYQTESLADSVRWAVKRFNKNPIALAREIFELYRGPGRLQPSEYFSFQLYDDKKYSKEEKRRFLSELLHWRIAYAVSDPKWEALIEDKWVAYSFLNGEGFPVPTTCAVIDKTIRSFGKHRKIGSPRELKNFLTEFGVYPLFAKSNLGLGSFGAFIIAGIDGEKILLENAESMTFDELFSNIIGERTFLVQTRVLNDPLIRRFTNALATVRTVNLVKADGVITPFTLLKIPAAKNVADNYWRPGNLLCNVDPNTGVIKRVVRGKGINHEEVTNHPETGDLLVGVSLPHWRELRELNADCARLFAPICYHSLDIAITEKGPVVIEINFGGGFDLPQFATGKGLLTDEIRGFFESCGYDFDRWFPPRRPKLDKQKTR